MSKYSKIFLLLITISSLFYFFKGIASACANKCSDCVNCTMVCDYITSNGGCAESHQNCCGSGGGGIPAVYLTPILVE